MSKKIELRVIKHYYDPIFKGNNKPDEIIRLYIDNTTRGKLFDELRLEYLRTYLNSNAIDVDALISIESLKSLIRAILDPEQADKLIQKEELSTKILDSINGFLKSEDASLDIDKILLCIIYDFGDSVIEHDDFIEILQNILLDAKLCDHSIDIQSYIRINYLHLNDTNYWDSNKEELIADCEIFILRRFFKIKAKNYHLMNCLSQTGPINIQILPSEEVPNLFTIVIGNIFIVGNGYIKDKILESFDKINEHLLIEEKEIKKLILSYLENVPEEFRNIIRNYLNLHLSQIFFNVENYSMFECIFSMSNEYMYYFLDSSTEVYKENIINFAENGSNLYGYLEDDLKSYYNLLEISKKYLAMYDEKYHAAIVWLTIKNEAVIHFSSVWSNEYGMHLKTEDNQSSLDELIDLYCRCQYIPAKDRRTIMLFTYYLININIFQQYNNNFIQCIGAVIKKIENKIGEIDLELFEKTLSNKPEKIVSSYSITNIDLMDGHEFEKFISLLFTKMGYDTTITKGSGDQGLDIIAEKNGTKIGIQAKCYTNKVSNKAVQEITAALKFYKCSKGIVITNNYFTDSAVELAESNNIVLWDRDFLKRKVEELFI